jgi:hypothetical protein
LNLYIKEIFIEKDPYCSSILIIYLLVLLSAKIARCSETM